jgi:hypothetical protein
MPDSFHRKCGRKKKEEKIYKDTHKSGENFLPSVPTRLIAPYRGGEREKNHATEA